LRGATCGRRGPLDNCQRSSAHNGTAGRIGQKGFRVVIGGTGLIGSKTVAIPRPGGHEVVAASPKSGINTITGEGIKEALAGARVVIDLPNSPSFEDRAVLELFERVGAQERPSCVHCTRRRTAGALDCEVRAERPEIKRHDAVELVISQADTHVCHEVALMASVTSRAGAARSASSRAAIS
jgi:hypothetical protein